jgi:7,8-dihydropterin-6-yl-methyl-4-(beta-D-ribofuranosyl)aminobenzene 5'-phosphate synthase
VQRRAIGSNGLLPTDTLLAEHGISLLLTAQKNNKRVGIIFDAGYSPVAAPRNLEMLAEPLDHVQALVVSHAHEDHTGAVNRILEMAGYPPLVVHPEGFFHPRYWKADDGEMYKVPEVLKREDLRRKGVEVIESSEPLVLGEGCFLITGEIPRVTDFEKALPGSVKEVDGELIPDLVTDDQAVVVDLDGYGLVVVSGCCHAGIVNTILYARQLTGGRPLYAVLGGFHLSGASFRSAIEPTLQALKAEEPAMVVPMHCTGVEAKALMRRELGPIRVDSSVGTRFVLPI